MPVHHLSDELLLDHAAGSLPEPVALLVATHLALCPSCREHETSLEAIGGALLDEIEPEPIEGGGLDALFARIEAAPPEPSEADSTAAATVKPVASDTTPSLPRPLRDYVGGAVDALHWRRRGKLSEARLLPDAHGGTVKLLRIPAGAMMPVHTHRGTELTLVLEGGFSDGRGHYLRGDVAIADDEVTHRPRADDDGDCLCLTVTEAPVRLAGPLARFLNPFLRD
jgi:putative transcriptional regulator